MTESLQSAFTQASRLPEEEQELLASRLGPEPQDITTVDQIVSDLEKSGGKFSTLVGGIINSAPFQRRHRPTP